MVDQRQKRLLVTADDARADHTGDVEPSVGLAPRIDAPATVEIAVTTAVPPGSRTVSAITTDAPGTRTVSAITTAGQCPIPSDSNRRREGVRETA